MLSSFLNNSGQATGKSLWRLKTTPNPKQHQNLRSGNTVGDKTRQQHQTQNNTQRDLSP